MTLSKKKSTGKKNDNRTLSQLEVKQQIFDKADAIVVVKINVCSEMRQN
jgi:hypothetical protein